MKSRMKIIGVIIMLIVLAGIYSVVDKTNSIYNLDVDTSEYSSIILGKNEEICQSFFLKEKQLDGVAVKMSADGNADSVEMHYILKDEKGEVVAEGEKSLKELKAGKFFEFPFERVENTQGKQYTFCLEMKKADEGSGAVVFGVPEEGDDTECMIAGERYEQTIALRTITHRFDIETFIVTLSFGIYVILFMKWLTKMFK